MFSLKFKSNSQGLTPQWETKLALESSGQKVIDLTGSNPTTVGLDYPLDLPALLNNQSVLLYQPDPRGLLSAREAIAEYYRSRGRNYRAEDLLLTASTSEAYAFLFKLLCDPGDEIWIPSPTYPLFDALAELENIDLIRYPVRATFKKSGCTWDPDMEFLRKQMSTRCKALILVNPNNPTGHVASPEEIRAYLDLAAEYHLALIVDEVFCEYLLGDAIFYPMESTGPLVFTLNGFSKLLGLPQLKLGWIHIAGAADNVEEAQNYLEWISDTYLSVNSPVQLATPGLLKLGPVIQVNIKNRVKSNLLRAEIIMGKSKLVRLVKPAAGWYVIMQINLPVEDEIFALQLLKKYHVQTYPGVLFGFEDECWLVLSLLGLENEFEMGLNHILTFAAEYQKD